MNTARAPRDTRFTIGRHVLSETVHELIIEAPIGAVYDQWTQLEEFPAFMRGVEDVTQMGDDRVHFRLRIGPHVIEYEARIVAQVPEERIVWESMNGSDTGGVVTFHALTPERTRVVLAVQYAPVGAAELLADRLGLVRWHTRDNLGRFKAYVESHHEPTGAWRGEIVSALTELELATDKQPHPEPAAFRRWPAEDKGPDGLSATMHIEHDAITRLLARLSAPGAVEEREAAWDEMLAALATHADASREVVYEPLASKRALRDRASRAMGELADMLALVEEMDGMSPGTPLFRGRLRQLSELVQAHATQVEETLLPLAASVFGPPVLLDMRTNFLAHKQRLLQAHID